MASAATCLHATSSIQAQGSKHVFPLQMVSMGFSLNMRLRARTKNFPVSLKLHVVHASSSHSSIADPIEVPSNSNSGNSEKKSSSIPLTPPCFKFYLSAKCICPNKGDMSSD